MLSPTFRSGVLMLILAMGGCTTTRNLKPITAPNGDVLYELTGYCGDYVSCRAVTDDECGRGLEILTPTDNSEGLWLFRCVLGSPKSIQRRAHCGDCDL
jgi:hypothetical protein